MEQRIKLKDEFNKSKTEYAIICKECNKEIIGKYVCSLYCKFNLMSLQDRGYSDTEIVELKITQEFIKITPWEEFKLDERNY